MKYHLTGTVVFSLTILALAVCATSSNLAGIEKRGDDLEEQIIILHRPGEGGGEMAVRGLPRGTKLLEPYGTFVLVSAPASTSRSLHAAGYEVSVLGDATRTGRGAYFFDTRQAPPDLPERWRANLEAHPTYDTYIVQLIGPLKQEWVGALRQAGAEVFDYLPSFSFIVAMEPPIRESVRRFPFVRWVGTYEPAYKVNPELLSESGDLLKIALALFPGRSSKRVTDIIAATGGTVTGKWSRGKEPWLAASVTGAATARLAALPEVNWMEPSRAPSPANNVATWVVQDFSQQSRTLHEQWGLRGQGQIVTLADSGVDISHPAFDDGGALPGPGHRKIQAYQNPFGCGDETDRTNHGTHVAGTIAGDAPSIGVYNAYDGHAFAARLLVQDINGSGGPDCNCDTDGAFCPPRDYIAGLFGPSFDEGSRIHTNSWGTRYDNSYCEGARQTDTFMWEHPDYLVLFGAGNEGPARGSLRCHANAKNILTVGASGNGSAAVDVACQNNRCFSSRGPSEDLRLKPTLMAPGLGIVSASNDSGYRTSTGTSMATPAVAGSATLVRQYFIEGRYPTGVQGGSRAFTPSAALVKAVLINGAQEMTGKESHAKSTVDLSNGYPRVIKIAGSRTTQCGQAPSPCEAVARGTGYNSNGFEQQLGSGQSYWLDVSFRVAADGATGEMIIASDARADARLSSLGNELVVTGGQNASGQPVEVRVSVTSGVWHSLRIFFNHVVEGFNVSLDGLYLGGPGFLFPFRSSDFTTVTVGTDNPASASQYGDVEFSNVRYTTYQGQAIPVDGWSVEHSIVLIEGGYPNNIQGWGRIDLSSSLFQKLAVFDEKSGFSDSGQVSEFEVQVTDPTQPLSITLAWTDYPGSGGTSQQIRNDLDLLVTAPDGETTYKGNVFTGSTPGQSATGGVRDSLNVEERVLILNPGGSGVWKIRVEATNIVQARQPFALAARGAITSAPPASLESLASHYVYMGELSGSVVLGANTSKTCKKQTVAGPATSNENVGGILIAGALGRASGAGLLRGLLDTEPSVATPCGTGILAPGNVISVGHRNVNLATRAINSTLPVRFANSGDGSGQGIYASESGTNFLRTVNADGSTHDYGLVAMSYDAAGDRYYHVVAGLTPLATRGVSELLAQNIAGDMPTDPMGHGGNVLQGTGVVVKLFDHTSDGRWDNYQVVDGTGGVIPMGEPAFFPRPVFTVQTFVLGEGSAHLGLAGASMSDAAAALPLAIRMARIGYQAPLAAIIDTEAVNPAGTAITLTENLLAVGPKTVNAVSKIINDPYLRIRFDDRLGICTTNADGTNRTCYQKSGRYGRGTRVTDYAMHSYGFYASPVTVVAGLTNEATQGAATAIADETVAPAGQGIVIELVDETGDRIYESVRVVDSVP